MSNVEDKIGRGISKVQDTFNKGKDKVESIKEISRLNKIIEDANDKKTEVLLSIGIDTYSKVRAGLINDVDLLKKCEGIVGFDYIIYNNKKKIEEYETLNEGFVCSCGHHLTPEDKFCGGCGQKVEMIIEEPNLKFCKNCDANISAIAKFCPCCGVKL